MERRDFLKGMAVASGAISAEALYGAQANRPAPQLLAQDNAPPGRRTIRGRARREFLPSPIRRNGMPRLAIITTRLRIRWPPWSGWGVSPAPGSR